MREIVQRTTAKDASPTEASTFNLDPDLEARMVEQDRLHHEGEKGVAPSLQQSPEHGGFSLDGYTGGTPDSCPRCGHDRIYAGGCENCGADLRDYGGDYNYGH